MPNNIKLLRAPFNFVPLADKVFFPSWHGQITQDEPFEDAVSGAISFKITAETPIFARNGHIRSDKDNLNDAYKSFNATKDGRFFIPSTSLKGCIRSVLEIISCGKLDEQFFKDSSFGIRDLSNGNDGTFYRSKIKPESIHCGWLKKKGDDYELDDCGLPWRISVEDIDNHTGSSLKRFVCGNDFKSDENRTAKKKYDLFGARSLEYIFSEDFERRKKLNIGGRQFVKFANGGEEGTIVFTGQPGQRRQKADGKWMGKFYEFVFPKERKKHGIKVEDYIIEDFLTVHKNSPDFVDFRKSELQKGDPIPVFFRYDNDGEIEAIGLSYMFKYPAYNSIHSSVPGDYLSTSKDLADCIFGMVKGQQALRGRVFFSNAFAVGHPEQMKEKEYVLSTPKPSYYPLYLGNGQSWNSENVTIAGRKRYPIRHKTFDNGGSDGMKNVMKPLPSGTEFVGVVRFHNLRKCEAGALVSAITFLGHSECRHNIGSGKPLGYGSVRIEIDSQTTTIDTDACIEEFKAMMKAHDPNWENSTALKELFAMAKGIPSGREDEFTYMNMSNNRNNNEFLSAKDEYSRGQQLGRFSQIIENKVPVGKFIGNVSVQKQRENHEANEQKKLMRENECKELLEKAKTLIDTADSISSQNFDQAIGYINQASKLTLDNSAIEKIRKSIQDKRDQIANEQKKAQEVKEKEKTQEKASAGLEPLLNERYIGGKNVGSYKVVTFKVCNQKVTSWMKAAECNHIPENQKEALKACLKRLCTNPDKNEAKDWKKFESKTWSIVSNWVGEDTARTWFEEF